jgi:hypothetical protein
MVDFNLTIKDHIHGLTTKLWFNNEQDINTLDTSIPPSYLEKQPNFSFLCHPTKNLLS